MSIIAPPLPTLGGIGAATATPVLELENLSVSYRDHRHHYSRAVHDVSLSIGAGEVLALVGESGSGKSTTAQAVIGLLAGNGRVDGGAIRLQGTDIAGWSQKRLESVRGSRIGLIPQDPTSSLNPVKTIGAQVGEALRLHGRFSRKERLEHIFELLARVGLSQPALRARQYPHELSGGMRQRALIAAAIALRPQLIIADEATSALDVTVQKRILDLIDELRREEGTAVLFVTHDLGVAADRSDRLVVLQGGRIQEAGRTSEVLANPRSSYTRALLADAPSLALAANGPWRSPVQSATVHPAGAAPAEAGIVVRDLVQEFRTGPRNAPVFKALDSVSFDVPAGTTHALVGESGSGKTTTVRALVGFHKATSGSISIAGTDVGSLAGEELRQFRRTVQLVHQNPFTSLDPRQSIRQIIEEPLLNFGTSDRAGRAARIEGLLERVRLPHAVLARSPRELSGGQRQRVAIARALALDPKVLVLDEAVSALDVTVQAQILALLEELQRELALTYVFISHDLAVVAQIADTVSVMSAGRVVESGTVKDVFLSPRHEYTRELIAAIPGQRGAVGVPKAERPPATHATARISPAIPTTAKAGRR
ncbi:dipeptide ABC transporter ATP-binding protein [Arthrobacter sp. 35W]|uniref:dipeptide ABC transporter ATP-binding protein n=1 Tax=Arthrobacter sp. 35W TaxID=1132441 RepID=UPI000412B9AC|nr:ABC transporter ATP-binding protein [Arthrobacter sp. 35W]